MKILITSFSLGVSMAITGCSSYWSACFAVIDVCHAVSDDPVSAECEWIETDVHWIDVMVDVGFFIGSCFENHHPIYTNEYEKRTIIKREEATRDENE